MISRPLNLQTLSHFFKQVFQNQASVLSTFVIVIIGMLLVPLPSFILDLAFVLNFSFAIGIILVTMYINEPLEFSTFPTLLLIITLARLALEISATRSILISGHAGNVIHSVGEFVVGGNFVVGIIIFLILFIVNFIVVTQGAGRVSEVAARFALDSMPGKQLAVDADLNAGLIDEAQAKERRKSIAREADFYSTMDGGSKFVKGDAVASIIIALINIVAGFIIGMVQLQMSAGEAASLFTLLTIGEGLASQIPALVISVATGILVTRSNPDVEFATDMGNQLFKRKEVIGISAGTMFILALGIRGAFIPFMTVALGLGWWAYSKYKNEIELQESTQASKAATDAEQEEMSHHEKLKQKEKDNSPEAVLKLLKVDQIELEIGYKLVGLIDKKQNGDLMSRIGQIRRQIMVDLGLPVPPVRVHDNLAELGADEYQIKLRGCVIAKGSVSIDAFLAVNTGLVDPMAEPLKGTETVEPSYGLPATWVKGDEKDRAESLGYTVATPSSVIATHLTEAIKIFAGEIISRQSLVAMLEEVKEFNESIVEEVSSLLSKGELLNILSGLLSEQVSIRDFALVLENIANNAKLNKDKDFLVERVREGLSRQIASQYLVDNVLNCMTFHPATEEDMLKSLHLDKLALEPSKAKTILGYINQGFEEVSSQGLPPVLLCNGKIRLPLRRILERSLPQLALLSYNEVPTNIDAQSVLTIGE
ncbi:MAG: flagellar biosynthesis protein FlhA [bacterium]